MVSECVSVRACVRLCVCATKKERKAKERYSRGAVMRCEDRERCAHNKYIHYTYEHISLNAKVSSDVVVTVVFFFYLVYSSKFNLPIELREHYGASASVCSCLRACVRVNGARCNNNNDKTQRTTITAIKNRSRLTNSDITQYEICVYSFLHSLFICSFLLYINQNKWK